MTNPDSVVPSDERVKTQIRFPRPLFGRRFRLIATAIGPEIDTDIAFVGRTVEDIPEMKELFSQFREIEGKEIVFL